MVFEYCDQVSVDIMVEQEVMLLLYMHMILQDLKKYFDSLATVISPKTVQVYSTK